MGLGSRWRAGRSPVPEQRGRPVRPDDQSRARLAAEALAQARADSRARGNHPVQPGGPARGPQREPGDAPGGVVPGAAADPQSGADGAGPTVSPAPRYRRRPRRDDPQPLQSAIEGLIEESGWRLAAATGSVFGRWAQIVGPELAAHTKPEGLTDGELTVTADSTAWATQVRLLAAQLVRRLNTELGDGAVKRVKVRGPAAPRQPGQWRVRGGRGPRDTYG